jgi:hypothetical protein
LNIERIGPTGPSKPSDKKGKTSTPDSEEFRELMKTGKVGETEFEKGKKRSFQRRQEGGEIEESSQITTPLKTTAPAPGFEKQSRYIKNYEEAPATDRSSQNRPSSLDEKKPAEKENNVEKKEEKKPVKKDEEKDLEGAVIFKNEFQNKKTVFPKEDEKIKKEIPSKTKIYTKETPYQKEEKPKKKEETVKPALLKIEQPLEKPLKKNMRTNETEETLKPEVSSVLQEMPSNIAAQTNSLTQTLTPYLHPEIVPLFEKMIGTIIQIQSQGITKTEIFLNSEAFASSIFFGSSISLEKYSTAPDSFNVFLKGPTEAVNVFNENIASLYDAFSKGNFGFKINRLEAEHERPLFKRKEKTSDREKPTK